MGIVRKNGLNANLVMGHHEVSRRKQNERKTKQNGPKNMM